jgi:hypothetical protein
MPSLYRIRHPYHTTFVLVIVPHSLPLSYHFRHRFHTTFVLPNIFNRLSINQFQNFPVFPTFPAFPDFPDFPPFPPFPAFPKVPPIPAIPNHEVLDGVSSMSRSIERCAISKPPSIFHRCQPRQWQQKIDKGIA